MAGTAAGVNRLAVALLAALLMAWPYIALDVHLPLGGWDLDAPVADVLALLLVPWGAWRLVRGHRPDGAAGYLVLVGAGLASAWIASDRVEALHEWARRPVFYGLAYGLGVTALVAAIDAPIVRRALAAAVAVAALISLATSAGRILAGDTLWYSAIAGLTNNHKTVAVALAPALAFLWGSPAPEAERRVLRGVVVLGVLALLASASRTAWISAGLAATWWITWRGRAWADRPWLVPTLAVLGFVAATYGPIATRSIPQIDAMRSRYSIDKRSWALFASSPLVGASPGQSVRTELVRFPEYRVNGVDAHGVVQKVGAEYGLLGLAGYGAFVWATGRRCRRRHRPGDGTWPAFVALHLNLLLSTETFTQTHWAMWALLVGSTRDDRPE